MRDGSPAAGSRGRPLVEVRGAKPPPPESSQHITDIWLPNHAQLCVFFAELANMIKTQFLRPNRSAVAIGEVSGGRGGGA